MTVTKREILISIILGCLSLCLGLAIDSWIVDWQTNAAEKYSKALKVNNDNSMFKYALETNVGDVIAYGKFVVEKGVTDSWLKNDYMYIEKVTEKYNRHTRTVCTGSGKSRSCRTETYYSWDKEDSEEKNVKKLNFSGVDFSFGDFSSYPKYKLQLSKENVVKKKQDKIKNNCIYEKIRTFGSNVGDKRYYYNVVNKSFYGTVFGKAKNSKLISESKKLDINSGNINDFIESNKNGFIIGRIFFWIIYIGLCGVGIYCYIAYENDYLED